MYYLLLGFLIGTFGLTFIEGVVEIFSTFVELIKTRMSVTIMRYGVEIQELSEESSTEETRVIGFNTRIIEDEEDDYGT